MEKTEATYWIETDEDIERATALLAGEQSAGTFVKVPLETEELTLRHGARVESIEVVGESPAPSLPMRREPTGQPHRQARVVVSFPTENTGHSLTALFTQLAGNLFELSPFSGLRLLDFEVSREFSEAQAGPAFGIAGTRRMARVADGPIIGTIVKPSVGLSPEATAGLVDELVRAGLDFIKDDELIANPPYSPVAERARAVMPVVLREADRTGRMPMVAFNITDTVENMKRHHDAVVAAGGTCVMYNLVAGGLLGLEALRAFSRVPIHAHRSGWGMLGRSPAVGMEYTAFQKFFRMAGADHMHVNGLRNKFCEPDESVIRSARACQTPIHGRHTVMPVFSSGQTAAQAPDTYAALGNSDLLYVCGGGILGHPDGAGAGVRGLREAWDAAAAGIPLREHAKTHPALEAALARFGK